MKQKSENELYIGIMYIQIHHSTYQPEGSDCFNHVDNIQLNTERE